MISFKRFCAYRSNDLSDIFSTRSPSICRFFLSNRNRSCAPRRNPHPRHQNRKWAANFKSLNCCLSNVFAYLPRSAWACNARDEHEIKVVLFVFVIINAHAKYITMFQCTIKVDEGARWRVGLPWYAHVKCARIVWITRISFQRVTIPWLQHEIKGILQILDARCDLLAIEFQQSIWLRAHLHCDQRTWRRRQFLQNSTHWLLRLACCWHIVNQYLAHLHPGWIFHWDRHSWKGRGCKHARDLHWVRFLQWARIFISAQRFTCARVKWRTWALCQSCASAPKRSRIEQQGWLASPQGAPILRMSDRASAQVAMNAPKGVGAPGVCFP